MIILETENIFLKRSVVDFCAFCKQDLLGERSSAGVSVELSGSELKQFIKNGFSK